MKGSPSSMELSVVVWLPQGAVVAILASVLSAAARPLRIGLLVNYI